MTRTPATRFTAVLLLIPIALVLAGCPQSNFVSADASSDLSQTGVGPSVYRDGELSVAQATPTSTAPVEKTVEEGDIYRVLSGSLILNLNPFRGLQVIDFADVEAPEIIGRHRISASPVELYVVGDLAIVLLNDWRRYVGVPYLLSHRLHSSGVVLAIDLSDPRNPTLADRVEVTGSIRTSRLTRAGDTAALYVTSQTTMPGPAVEGSVPQPAVAVTSYAIEGKSLVERDRVDLGGYVRDIQATPEAILVSRQYYENDGTTWKNHNHVSLIDISSPTGALVEGGEAAVAGLVGSQFNMDLHEGILRVFSTNWIDGRVNHLETFDASDIHDLVPVEKLSFAEGESLFATLFVGNKAFAVTYLRVDPFHAFEIDAEGHAREASEFIVSGWNDFFRPVLDASRLVGIGVDDADQRILAVSLYDITDLESENPLVARENIAASTSTSAARWDHQAFSVLENAVIAEAPDDTLETGLVLLPYHDYVGGQSVNAVQIMTFSSNTLTRRGTMLHPDFVRRSFMADEDLAANLSARYLGLYDIADVNAPEAHGKVELSPTYVDILAPGPYRVRLKQPSNYRDPYITELIPRDQDPDLARPIGSFEVPTYSQIYATGDGVIAGRHYAKNSTFDVFDISDPVAPGHTGSFVSDERHWNRPVSTSDALVFIETEHIQRKTGTTETCYTRPNWPDDCREKVLTDKSWRWEFTPNCTTYSNYIRCQTVTGEETTCWGELRECTTDEEAVQTCEPVASDQIETVTTCSSYDNYAYSRNDYLRALDVRDPEHPALGASIPLAKNDRSEYELLADGSDVWLSFREVEPQSTTSESALILVAPYRPRARFYIQRYDFSDPLTPSIDDKINVPGKLLAVDDDIIFTRDFKWTDDGVGSSVDRLELIDGKAYLQARRSFHDEFVEIVLEDDAGHLVVGHRERQRYDYRYPMPLAGELRVSTADVVAGPWYWMPTDLHFTVLDAMSEDLDRLSTTKLGPWASLQDAVAGRIILSESGGILVFNLDDPKKPYAQAFFPAPYAGRVTLDDRDILVPAYYFGIFSFDLDEFNLIEP